MENERKPSVYKKSYELPQQHFIAYFKQITGVEPASPAWEASILPMNYICMNLVYHRKIKKEREKYSFYKRQQCDIKEEV